MAKDGTMRGGARPNTGPKKKALADKIIEGKASVEDGAVVLPEPVEIEGVDMPPIKDFLKAKQKNGNGFRAVVYGDCVRSALVGNLMLFGLFYGFFGSRDYFVRKTETCVIIADRTQIFNVVTVRKRNQNAVFRNHEIGRNHADEHHDRLIGNGNESDTEIGERIEND